MNETTLSPERVAELEEAKRVRQLEYQALVKYYENKGDQMETYEKFMEELGINEAIAKAIVNTGCGSIRSFAYYNNDIICGDPTLTIKVRGMAKDWVDNADMRQSEKLQTLVSVLHSHIDEINLLIKNIQKEAR